MTYCISSIQNGQFNLFPSVVTDQFLFVFIFTQVPDNVIALHWGHRLCNKNISLKSHAANTARGTQELRPREGVALLCVSTHTPGLAFGALSCGEMWEQLGLKQTIQHFQATKSLVELLYQWYEEECVLLYGWDKCEEALVRSELKTPTTEQGITQASVQTWQRAWAGLGYEVRVAWVPQGNIWSLSSHSPLSILLNKLPICTEEKHNKMEKDSNISISKRAMYTCMFAQNHCWEALRFIKWFPQIMPHQQKPMLTLQKSGEENWFCFWEGGSMS